MHLRYTGISSFALLLSLAQGAHAQTETTADRSAVPADQKAADEHARADDEATVVVTGSRLPSEFSLASPVQVITRDSAARAGRSTVAEMVAASTAAAGTQQINNRLSSTGAGGSVVEGGTNANTISLRNLSPLRTLTLVNGQRIAPSGTGSQVGPVDYNVLASVAVDRVEILTTGASSVYGSDAIAGVVNVVTRKGGNGLELNAFSRLPEKTGGRYVDLSAYWGRNYDRWYVGVGVEYDRQYQLDLKDRPQTACAQDFVYNPTTGARVDARDRSGNYRCYNHNPTGIFFDRYWYGGAFVLDPTMANGPYPAAALSLHSTNNPVLAPLNDWVRANRGGYPDTYAYSPNTSSAYANADSISPFRKINAYFSAGYGIDADTEISFSALYSNRQSTSNSWYFLYPYIAATNPNNTVGQALIAASNGRSNGEVGAQIVRPFRSEQRVDFFQSTLGLRGSLGGVLPGWKYDLTARVGLSRGSYGQTFYYNDRLQAATAPGVACDPSLITISAPTNCVSIPWLSKRFLVDGAWTDAERAYLEGFEWGKTSFDEYSIDGSISGNLFSLPAGNVAAVLGFSVRVDDLDDRPGYNAQRGNYFAFSTAGRTAGSDTVKEVFGEVGVPLLSEKPFAKKLAITASGRYTDYASYGSNGTYKVNGVWQVVAPIAFRASYGTSFRAPSLYELNLANQTSFFNYSDPCMRYGDGASAAVTANCRAEGFTSDFAPVNSGILGVSGGGKGLLKAETSTSFNAGTVIRPGIAGIELAVDYYAITVDNEVATFGVPNIINACYTRTTDRDSFCSRITRDPVTRAITTVNNRFVNLSEQRTRGIDVAFHTQFALPAEIAFSLDVRGSRTLENSLLLDAQSPRLERNGLSGFPKLTGYAEINLRRKSLSWFMGANYIGAVDDTRYHQEQGNFIPGTTNFAYYGAYAGLAQYGNGNDFSTVREKLSVPAQVIFYTSLRVQLNEKTMIMGGIDNLFDRAPPTIGSDAFTYRTGSVPGNLYNLTGRTFYLKVGRSF